MYSLQSLWTQARENLPCTTIILSNRKYQILMAEYKNVGASPGQTAFDMMDLGNPDIDWIKLANGMGVEAQKVSTFERLSDVLHYSFDTPSPFLIELEI
jgi:acetolactate synthase-1/2/3 large subunit